VIYSELKNEDLIHVLAFELLLIVIGNLSVIYITSINYTKRKSIETSCSLITLKVLLNPRQRISYLSSNCVIQLVIFLLSE